MLVEQTLLQMIMDRNFSIGELEEIAFLPTDVFEENFENVYDTFDNIQFDNNFNVVERGFSIGQVFQNKFWDVPFLEIFSNEKGETLLAMIAPFSKKTKGIDKQQGIEILKMLNIVKPTYFILVVDNPKIDNIIYSYSERNTTVFTDSELQFNVTRHNYSVGMRLATKEELKQKIPNSNYYKFLPKRLESDLTCRYYGFKHGNVAIEIVKELSLPSSIITAEEFPVLIISSKK